MNHQEETNNFELNEPAQNFLLTDKLTPGSKLRFFLCKLGLGHVGLLSSLVVH